MPWAASAGRSTADHSWCLWGLAQPQPWKQWVEHQADGFVLDRRWSTQRRIEQNPPLIEPYWTLHTRKNDVKRHDLWTWPRMFILQRARVSKSPLKLQNLFAKQVYACAFEFLYIRRSSPHQPKRSRSTVCTQWLAGESQEVFAILRGPERALNSQPIPSTSSKCSGGRNHQHLILQFHRCDFVEFDL